MPTPPAYNRDQSGEDPRFAASAPSPTPRVRRSAAPRMVSPEAARARTARRSADVQERIAQRVNASTAAGARRPSVHSRSGSSAGDPRIDHARPSIQAKRQARDLRRSSDKFRAVLAAVVVLVVLLGVSQIFRAGQADPASQAAQDAAAEQAAQDAAGQAAQAQSSAQQSSHEPQSDQAGQAPQAAQASSSSQAQSSQTSSQPQSSESSSQSSPSGQDSARPGPAGPPPSYAVWAPMPNAVLPDNAPLHNQGRDLELERLIEAQKEYAASVDLKARDAWFDVQTPHEWNFEPNGRKTVYLTFDDGPSPLTPQVLEVLQRYGTPATFFVVGSYPDYYDYIKVAYDAGHTIALHTASHDYAYVYSSTQNYFDDLATIGGIVESQIGYVPAFVRFPGGTSNSISANYASGIMSVLSQEVPSMGYQYYDWNSANGDAMGGTPTAEELISIACSYDEENLIMLMHDSEFKTSTLEALPAIIEHFLRQGYRFEALTPDSMVYHHEPGN